MIKLDSHDKKILEILLSNSREQVSSIGKKIRLRRENVNYKISRLIKQGLIKEFNTVLNEKQLGLVHYTVFLELVNLQNGTEREILDYLKKNGNMSWIGTSAGKWSLTFDIVVLEKTDLDSIISDLLTKFGNYIDDYVILKLQDSNYFGFKFLGIKNNQNIRYEKYKKVKLDETDFKILSLLNTNSRISLVDLSEKVRLTPNGVANRIKNLEKNNVIMNYTISLEWKELGYEWYGLQLKLIKFGKEIDKKITDYFLNHKKVEFYYRYFGGTWDYDFGLIVKNSIELREFINEFRKNFSDIAKISDVFIVLDEASGYKLPNDVFV